MVRQPVSQTLCAIVPNILSVLPKASPDGPLLGLLRLGISGAIVISWFYTLNNMFVPVMKKLLVPSFAVVLLARFWSGGWARRDDKGAFKQPWAKYEAGDGLASAGWRGGVAEVLRETVGVIADFIRPAGTVLAAYGMTWRDAYEKTLGSLCILGCYCLNYGLLSPMGLVCFWYPIEGVSTLVRVNASLTLTVQWLSIVFGFWQFYNIANNISFHRYFSHRCFATGRLQNAVLGVLGATAGQRGPLWWASTHRRHHKHCETPLDPHCPSLQGFWYSHCGWTMDRDNFPIRLAYVRDWLRQFPELLLADAFCVSIATAFQFYAPILVQTHILENGLGVRLPPGFVNHAAMVGTSMSLHFEFLINSWCHSWEMPPTEDEQKAILAQRKGKAQKVSEPEEEPGALDLHGSVQSAAWEPCKGTDHHWVGLLNAGEGYHAGHHEDGKLAQHGTYWFQDTTYMSICVCEALGLVWNVKRSPITREGGDPAAPAKKKA